MAAEKRERLCNIKNTREPKRLVFPKMQLYQRVEDRSGAGGADTQSSKTALKVSLKNCERSEHISKVKYFDFHAKNHDFSKLGYVEV